MQNRAETCKVPITRPFTPFLCLSVPVLAFCHSSGIGTVQHYLWTRACRRFFGISARASAHLVTTHMKIVDWNGWQPVVELIDNGVALDKIADRWGRSVHPVADAFLAYHVQVKKMMLKEYHNTHKQKRQVLKRVLRTRALNSKHELDQLAADVLQNATAKTQKRG